MSKSIRRELYLPHTPHDVWRALTEREAMAEWLLPSDFEPRVGHRFTLTLRTPPEPNTRFDGVIHCEVLECDAPRHLAYSWAAAGLDTRVSYRLEPDGEGTRLFFEQSGFDTSESWGRRAFKGAEGGWDRFFDLLQRTLNARSPQS